MEKSKMREHKFKLINELNQNVGIFTLEEIGNGVCSYLDFSKITFCEYTNLKDKNGKEIYEGDICKKTYGSSTPVFTVAYHDARGMFIMQDGYNEPLYTVNNFMIEVIGNIYENPELINKQN